MAGTTPGQPTYLVSLFKDRYFSSYLERLDPVTQANSIWS